VRGGEALDACLVSSKERKSIAFFVDVAGVNDLEKGDFAYAAAINRKSELPLD
jgi:hypothetical protein